MALSSQQFNRAIAIAKKNLRIYYRRGPVVIFGLIMPFFLFLSYFLGRNMPIESLIIGLVGMTIYFSSMSIGPAIVPFEARQRTLERLLAAPVAVWAMLVGDVLASFLFGFCIGFVPLGIGLVMGVQIVHPLILMLGMVLAAFCFAAFSVLLSSYPPTDIPSTVMMISNLVKFPLVFISGVFFRLWEIQAWGRIISSFSPLTYFIDLVEYCIRGVSYYTIYVDILALIAFSLIFLAIAIKVHERTMPQRLT
jgi:ABC-2 type transport system permease protein